ncbi:hypothetical protein INT47_001475 [Mucor saturninus]|uniref:Uncharacterized protein n=1 Tax=Mucor saturninus TaxID=64648 RepID=A0A8H7UWN8_9FUNG|nr:hypothetical protein INT47_001475 [Mucor saturninus]
MGISSNGNYSKLAEENNGFSRDRYGEIFSSFFRAAASTKAVDLGMSFETVKDHANWSQNSSTFENYYYRPRDQHARDREITQTFWRRYQEQNHIWSRSRAN